MSGNNQNNQNQFSSGNINPREPVRTLLGEFFRKNKQVFNYYSFTTRRSTKCAQKFRLHYTVPGHPLYAFNDYWNGKLDPDYCENFNYKSMSPKYITGARNKDKSDPLAELLHSKYNWQRNVRQQSLTAVRNEKLVEKYDDVMYCPSLLVKAAATMDSDPDVFFNSMYNWYYTGNGNVHLISIDWVDYLLHCDHSFLYISHFNKVNVSVNIGASVFDCGDGVNIYETLYSQDNIVVLRTKYKIFILKIIASDVIKVEKLKVLESELPYTSCNFDTFHKQILYVTSLDCKVIIVNLHRLVGKDIQMKCTVSSLVDNWCSVVGSDRTTYTYVNYKRLTMFDKRTHNIAYKYKDIRHLCDMVCNRITVAKQCEDNHSLYLGTEHHLFLMDTRCMSMHKPKVIQRWTHGMVSTPTYMSICNMENNKEMINLSSQWCEDNTVIVNYKRETICDQMPGVTMPFRLPHVFDLLYEARNKGLCSDLYCPIEQRLGTAISGTALYENGTNYVVLTHNALGDITSHVLYPERLSAYMEDKGVEDLDEWCKLFKTEPKDFDITQLTDICEVLKNLKKVPDTFITEESEELVRLKSKFSEKEIQEAFESELDSGLLEVWEKDNEEFEKRSSDCEEIRHLDENCSDSE